MISNVMFRYWYLALITIIPFLVILGLPFIENVFASKNKKQSLIEILSYFSLKSDILPSLKGVILGWLVSFIAVVIGLVAAFALDYMNRQIDFFWNLKYYILDNFRIEYEAVILFLVIIGVTNLLPRLFVGKKNWDCKSVRGVTTDHTSQLYKESNRIFKFLLSYITLVNSVIVYLLIALKLMYINPTPENDFMGGDIENLIFVSALWLIFFFSSLNLLIKVRKRKELLLKKINELEISPTSPAFPSYEH